MSILQLRSLRDGLGIARVNPQDWRHTNTIEDFDQAYRVTHGILDGHGCHLTGTVLLGNNCAGEDLFYSVFLWGSARKVHLRLIDQKLYLEDVVSEREF